MSGFVRPESHDVCLPTSRICNVRGQTIRSLHDGQASALVRRDPPPRLIRRGFGFARRAENDVAWRMIEATGWFLASAEVDELLDAAGDCGIDQ